MKRQLTKRDLKYREGTAKTEACKIHSEKHKETCFIATARMVENIPSPERCALPHSTDPNKSEELNLYL